MKKNNCIAHCECGNSGRRDFIKKASLITAGSILTGHLHLLAHKGRSAIHIPRSCGPASDYVPVVKAAFVRRQEDYGMLWPGEIYDGETARKNYTEEINRAAIRLGIQLDMKSTPVYSLEEANTWLEEAKGTKADGLVLLILDRQKHAWPTAQQAGKSGIPTVIYSPLGTSFTVNTAPLADTPGCVVFSTNDFNQCIYGLKMLKAGALMKRTRCVVIQGNERKEIPLADTGIILQYIPVTTFYDIYNAMPVHDEIVKMADEYVLLAAALKHATREDVINGIKSYLVAGEILEIEKADAISMDCLGALSDKKISLPCISWSKMNDNRIPAACEADPGAIAAQIIVQYLFDRPGFQQDPVADTSDDTLIGAHCSCPTRLNGFDLPPEPFEIVHHHGNRDAVPRTIWGKGQRITCMDFLPAGEVEQVRSQMLISTGVVEDNMNVPPSGGCVVSVKVKLDEGHEVLSFPGFHQLFFYGDYKRELKAFCKLYNFDAKIV
jgi:hypothetical protein